jgi:hypothetical protein
MTLHEFSTGELDEADLSPSAAAAPTQPRILEGREAARAHVELLTANPNATIRLRLIHDSDRNAPAQLLYGRLDELWPQIDAAQAGGYGVFVVVNEGGNSDAEISCVRAVFVDADDVLLSKIKWHVPPDFIVQRDATHWHAYWRVNSLEVERFRDVQKRLAAHYGTDPSVSNPSRVMRLAGTLHQKRAVQ